MNTNKSQIIITTQDQQLLNEDFIRRDMIWFAEKVKETAATIVNRASDFGIHKNASLYNAYRTGKLGAKPELGNVFIKQYHLVLRAIINLVRICIQKCSCANGMIIAPC